MVKPFLELFDDIPTEKKKYPESSSSSEETESYDSSSAPTPGLRLNTSHSMSQQVKLSSEFTTKDALENRLKIAQMSETKSNGGRIPRQSGSRERVRPTERNLNTAFDSIGKEISEPLRRKKRTSQSQESRIHTNKSTSSFRRLKSKLNDKSNSKNSQILSASQPRKNAFRSSRAIKNPLKHSCKGSRNQ